MNISCDDRRLGFFDLFPTPGQVNVVRLRKGAICAWHQHQKQNDYYFCVSGAVKVGMIRTHDTADGNPAGEYVEWFVLDEHNPATVTIPPGNWHGYMALTDGAVLCQYLDQKYDASNPDEQRMSVKAMDVDWQSPPASRFRALARIHSSASSGGTERGSRKPSSQTFYPGKIWITEGDVQCEAR